MAVQMDKPSVISPRERAQRLYNKNVELENTRRKSAHARVPSDPNVWQQLRENYEAIILEDLSFSEQLEIELALWQLHYRRIEELRALYNAASSSKVSSAAQNGNGGPARPDRLARIRSQFKTFLSEATGFYHELMLKIRAKYGLSLDYFSDDHDNQILLSKDGQKIADIKKGLISCHRCLIYLGDLARYKALYGDGESKTRDFAAATSYYVQASSLWPSGGNPHHQLAIVAAYHGDELAATYRYFRSLAVESPFTTARDNLIIAFERNRQNYTQLLGESKTPIVKAATSRMSGKGKGRGDGRGTLSKENRRQTSPSNEKAPSIPETLKGFCIKFVRVNGILFTRTSLETFADVLSMAKNDFLVLLSSGLEDQYKFGSDAAECGLAIVRLVAILIFTVHNVKRESENQSYAEILQRSVLLQNAYTAVFEFMGHIVERCLQLRDPLSCYLMPGILVFVEWLACHPDVATCSEAGEIQANARIFFWNSCITLFNKLLSSGLLSTDEDETCFSNMSKYEEGETSNRLALWEDFELRGFLPLHPAHQILDFSRKHTFGNGSDGGIKEKTTRVQRIIAAGKVFANVVRVEQQGVYFDSDLQKFIFGAEAQLCLEFSPETLMSNIMGQELSGEKKSSPRALGPAKVAEVDDEEEVIVFKPSAADKQADVGYPALTSCEDLGLVVNVSGGNLGVYNQPVSASPNGNLLNGVFHNGIVQNGLDATLRPSMSVANASSQHMQPTQLPSSGWLPEQQASVLNGFRNLSLMGNGHIMNQKPSEHFTPLQSAALSLPFSHAVNSNTSNGYPVQVSEAVMPSKTNFIISSGPDLNISTIIKPRSVFPVGSQKNPVSRPIRRLGPPPGFTPATPKYAIEPQHEPSVKDGNPMMDDYSWLDGYQMPSSTKQDTGFDLCTNSNGSLYSHVSKWNDSPGAISFPFPGKQASVIQTPVENNRLWQDYQFPGQLNLCEQQRQLGNQKAIPFAPQFQGQSLWEGHFLV
ncbi:protein SMG7-like [Chenopodium quinoa]|uniref:SMG7 n=1 Tax=Chenopodium quinoa TaxID=63459 RepID=A0A803LT00_CHEQI|nr:protein SMG7-like [Chenopodium quinoa]